MEISLRNACELDMPFLLALREATMRQYLVEAGMPTSQEEYEKRIRFEFDHAQIVEWGGGPIGLFKATYSNERKYWYIVQIQIDPEYQGMRIGSWLINRVIEKAKTTGATVGLSVINSNPAKHLYFRLGFREVSTIDAEQLMELKP
ncbi:GNAT family N-acetyltransferase [Photobacterium sp. DNB22_13_2]